MLVVAGDVTPVHDHGLDFQWQWLDGTFRRWLSDVPAAAIVGIAGNHDFVFQQRDVADLELPWTYLRDSGAELGGLSFWGIPWVPKLRNWAFYAPDDELAALYGAVPEGTDVLVSHGPPYGVLDKTVPSFGAVHAGAPALNEAIERVQPRLAVFGHIHEAYGRDSVAGVPVVNASRVNEIYEPVNALVEWEL